MPLELHSNDNAREGRPSVWIFQGNSVVLLVAGVAAFVALFRILVAAEVRLAFSACAESRSAGGARSLRASDG